MAISKKLILELVADLPEEKLGKVISFIRYIKDEEEPVLLLDPDDEEDIIRILNEDKWYDSDEIIKMIKDKRDE